MPHWRKNHDSDANLLKHYHLLDEAKTKQSGRDVYVSPVVTIEKMTVDRLKSREKPKGERRNIAHFKGKDKPLGLNVTACETLESFAGNSDPASWVGLTIQLFVDPNAKYVGGKRGPAIRISPKLPRGQADTPLPDVSADAIERLDAAQQERLGERQPGEEG